MTEADKNFIETCKKIIKEGYSSEGTGVRTRWQDGEEANYISIVGVSNVYNVGEEFPMITLRNNSKTVIRAIDEIELTFDYNTVGIENETIIVLYGTGSYTLSNTVYNEDAKYGYKVNNWTLSEDGSGTSYANGDSIPVKRLRDMVIYANYVGAPYTIKIAGITSTIGGALNNASSGTEATIEQENGNSKTFFALSDLKAM